MKPRSLHNLSHFRNTTGHMGQLIPICVMDVLHGDTFKANSSMFMRLSPLAAPIMHPVHCHVHHYFVPYRIIWNEFTDFITGGEDFDDASVVPTIDFAGSPVTKGSLANHLGLPVGFASKAEAFRFRAYNMIYNEIYRDDQLQPEVAWSPEGGADTTTVKNMMNVNWNKDYFVGARPDEQLGTEVTLPLTGNAPVKGLAITSTQANAASGAAAVQSDGTTVAAGTRGWPSTALTVFDKINSAGNAGSAGHYPNIYADLSDVSAASINDLRLAIATQQWQEIINSTGNKFEDYLRRYGIKYSDARLQRPEYLGGGRQTVQFSEVLQTSEGVQDGVGSMKGHGIAALRSNDYIKFFEEPGVIISFAVVKPIRMYMQGVHKTLTRKTKEEFYQREYEILGWQEVKNREIYHNHATPDGTFGYTPRHEEYRSIPNTVHGDFTDFYKDWTLVDEFGGPPALNSTFVTCTPSKRIFQDQTNPGLIMNVQNKVAARRFVPKFNKPSGLTV